MDIKLYYTGKDGKRNGVGIILDSALMKGVIEVNKESDRLIWMKLEVSKILMNVISVYSPQQGCEEEDKEAFWDLMDEVMRKIHRIR